MSCANIARAKNELFGRPARVIKNQLARMVIKAGSHAAFRSLDGQVFWWRRRATTAADASNRISRRPL